MNDAFLSLLEENKRLSHLAETDWLTGLYNRMAVEKKVNELLSKRQCGVLFVIDVDHFKAINDRYGHLAGDGVLQEIAHALTDMTLCNDVIGRIGGDEFVIFMPIRQGPDFVESRCRQIEQHFRDLPRSQFMESSLSLTVCGSCYQTGDSYSRLFDRADQCLLKEKAARRKRKRSGETGPDRSPVDRSLEIDIKRISRELSEPGQANGAYCQDFDNFVNIYRFVERRLRRAKSSVYTILITLMDEGGDFPVLQEIGPLMDSLHEMIQYSLRSGDVFTRYSSCQFLIMVCDATDLQTDSIAERIREKFDRDNLGRNGYKLTYNRYPLQPAFSSQGEA